MKILLLGGNGFLGTEIKNVFSKKNINFLAPERKKLDILTPQLEKFCQSFLPDLIINCVAYTDVDGAEVNVDSAYLINAEFPARLAKICKYSKVKLIHFSTDYIFDGEKKEGYKEEDLPCPISIYGKSKLMGEKNIAQNMEDYLIIRTSFPFGNNPKCFLQKIIQNAKKNGYLKMIDDLVCSPTNFQELAEEISKLIFNFPVKGIYHLTNFGSCTRYEFTKAVLKVFKIKAKVEPYNFTEDELQKIIRPRNSILINTKLDKMQSWTDSMEGFQKDFFEK